MRETIVEGVWAVYDDQGAIIDRFPSQVDAQTYCKMIRRCYGRRYWAGIIPAEQRGPYII